MLRYLATGTYAFRSARAVCSISSVGRRVLRSLLLVRTIFGLPSILFYCPGRYHSNFFVFFSRVFSLLSLSGVASPWVHAMLICVFSVGSAWCFSIRPRGNPRCSSNLFSLHFFCMHVFGTWRQPRLHQCCQFVFCSGYSGVSFFVAAFTQYWRLLFFVFRVVLLRFFLAKS